MSTSQIRTAQHSMTTLANYTAHKVSSMKQNNKLEYQMKYNRRNSAPGAIIDSGVNIVGIGGMF